MYLCGQNDVLKWWTGRMRLNWSEILLRGGGHPKATKFPCGLWDMHSAETAAAWSTRDGWVGRSVPWGYRRETGTIKWGVNHSTSREEVLIGLSFWNASACLADTWNLSTTEFTASPKRPEGERGASIRKFLCFPLILLKINHTCLSVATRAAMDRPIDLAISLVALRDKSVARRSSQTVSGPIPSPSKRSANKSAW